MIRIFCFFILFITYSNSAKAINIDEFKSLPVQQSGRIEPIDTVARRNLIFLAGRDHLQNMSASDWFAQLLFDPEAAYLNKIFKINNPDILSILELEARQKHLYSFAEVAQGVRKQSRLIIELAQKNIEDLPLIHQSLMEIYIKYLWFYNSSRNLSLILPEFSVNNPNLAATLNLPPEASYIEMLAKTPILTDLMLRVTKKENPNEADQEVLNLVQQMKILSEEKKDPLFRIIPEEKEKWLTPWQYLNSNNNKLTEGNYLDYWQNLAFAYQSQDQSKWDSNLQKLEEKLAPYLTDQSKLKLEVFYNDANLFIKVKLLYLISLLLIFIGSLIHQKKSNFYYQSAFLFLTIGAVLHFITISLRIVIMSRPPVATLYESIIFVAFIVVALAIILQLRKRYLPLTLISSIVAIILLFVSEQYNIGQDDFAVLEAVLKNNFWLATHVLTISIGYACCLICGTLAHLYLIMANRKKTKKESLTNLINNIFTISLIALLFVTVGTILGGIWADQSWGRFWGWDPKENGALLICLWLIFILHARLAKMLSNFNYAIAMSFLNIVVILAWYGVNLLNVGLHSYGFTENIATNLAIFCSIEILFLLLMYYLQLNNGKNNQKILSNSNL